jgi:hypothetical protein
MSAWRMAADQLIRTAAEASERARESEGCRAKLLENN